jgi:hypothetical protein
MVETYVPAIQGFAQLAVRSSDDIVGRLHAAVERLKADGSLAAIGVNWGVTVPRF